MTQEEKKLLVKDLCARLPFNPHVYIKDGKDYEVIDIVLNGTYIHDWLTLPSCQNITIMPYLRPMSSITKEEEKELDNYVAAGMFASQNKNSFVQLATEALLADFFNKHHIDYRGLIPMGLALEAPEGMYKIE